ncbi:MAG: substrate-binding domain-containing protein [Bacteroidota bacterium]
MKTVSVCGVPEHFNMPWHLAMAEGAFEKRGIVLEWISVPEGTGRMSQMLAKNETDLAIILTEGIVKSISEGNPAKIVQTYVDSPLLWGIHVAANSSFTTIPELIGKKAAISRLGSGSHLMAFVHARQQGWDIHKLRFEVVHTLEGAVESLKQGRADYFMWEHFTTKPLVDNGTFRWLGDCPTPWPCFVIAASGHFLEKDNAIVQHILETINLFTREFKYIPSIDSALANRYGQQLEDIRLWLTKTQWGQQQLDPKTLSTVIDTLSTLQLLGKMNDPRGFITS